MLYLYGIVDGCEAPDAVPCGLEDREPYVLPYREMSAIAGELQHGQPQPCETALRKHLSVIEAFMARHTVLPVRFGTVFADPAELGAYLALSYDQHAATLHRLSGQFELGLRVLWPQTEARPIRRTAIVSEDCGPGARYLAERYAEAEARKGIEREAHEVADALSTFLMPCCTEVLWRRLPRGGSGASIAYLLHRERLGDFRAALAGAQCAYPDLDILCTGPWPPYSFVGNAQSALSKGAFHADHEERAFG